MSGGPQDQPDSREQGEHPRGVDPDRAALTGEAAGQERGAGSPGYPTTTGTLDRRPDRAVGAGRHAGRRGGADGAPGDDGDGSTTYYDQPAIKEPVWIWSVPVYFYVGGVTAGSVTIAAAAQFIDRAGFAGLIRAGRWIGVLGGAVSGGLLIHDLGRPERFYNMLRVFRPTSAMNMGSWLLAASSGGSAAAAVLPLTGSRTLRAVGEAAGGAAVLPGTLLGTYTAVLLSDSAVPIWQVTRRSTPALFGASAMSAGAAALDLLPVGERGHELTARVGAVARLAEAAVAEVVEHEADAAGRVGRPLHDGASGALWRASKVANWVSIGLGIAPTPRRWRRAVRVASAVLASASSLLMRFAVFRAGFASARDPRATFEVQRAGRGAAEVTGHAAVTGPGDTRALG